MIFLDEPAESAAQHKMYDDDLADDGYVWNVSRLWGHQPAAQQRLFGLMGEMVPAAGLSNRQRGVLVAALDPNGTTAEDVQALRDAGFDDAAIPAPTHFVGAGWRSRRSTTCSAPIRTGLWPTQYSRGSRRGHLGPPTRLSGTTSRVGVI